MSDEGLCFRRANPRLKPQMTDPIVRVKSKFWVQNFLTFCHLVQNRRSKSELLSEVLVAPESPKPTFLTISLIRHFSKRNYYENECLFYCKTEVNLRKIRSKKGNTSFFYAPNSHFYFLSINVIKTFYYLILNKQCKIK